MNFIGCYFININWGLLISFTIIVLMCFRVSLDSVKNLEIVQLYYRNGDSLTACLRAYKTKYHLHNDLFSIKTIERVINHFVEHKTLHASIATGRPSLKAARSRAVKISLEFSQSENPQGHATLLTVALHSGKLTSLRKINYNYYF